MFSQVSHFINGGEAEKLYSGVSTTVKLFQTLAILEVVHPVLGLVKTNPVVAFQQVFGR